MHDSLRSRPFPGERNPMKLQLRKVTGAVAILTALGISGHVMEGSAGNDASTDANLTAQQQTVADRGDIVHLPGPLKDRIIELAGRPHSVEPLTVFAEAAKPSELFGYFLLDTKHFEPNAFTSIIPGVNDG